MTITIKKGDKGSLVGMIQQKLGIKPTNYFGDVTEKLLKQFQAKNQLTADGIAGEKTLAKLGIIHPEQHLSTDVSNISNTVKKQPDTISPAPEVNPTPAPAPAAATPVIKTVMLSPGQYKNEVRTKLWLFLHHTAGSHNPVAVVNNWNTDTRGAIATEYVIGGKSINGKDDVYDGMIVKCMPTGTWAYHLGDNGNAQLHPQSIGIEICNYGWLTKGGYTKNNKWVKGEAERYYTYVGSTVPADQVCDLGFEFNGFRYYHAYTDKQIEALRYLIPKLLKENPSIDVSKGLKEWLHTETPAKAFGYKDSAYKGITKGLLTHTNVRKDKTDCSPQPKLVALIKSL